MKKKKPKKQINMNKEIEIKLEIPKTEIGLVVEKMEQKFGLIAETPFLQTTYQFFTNDFSTQKVFPRIRNEVDGRTTLTLKVKKEDSQNYFKRLEYESGIDDPDAIIGMMEHLGFPYKVIWQKKRTLFKSCRVESGDVLIPVFSLDETPIGFFLEVEGTESGIEDAIKILGTSSYRRIPKSYLALWEEYKKEKGIDKIDMVF